MSVKYTCDNPLCAQGVGETVKEEEIDLSSVTSPICPFDPPYEWTVITKQGAGGLEVKTYCCPNCQVEGEA